MTRDKTETHTFDLSGSQLTINGKSYYVDSGTLEWRIEYLFAADDEPGDPTETQHVKKIHVELANFDDQSIF